MDEQRFFDLIEHLPNKETKLYVLLLFLEEIGGMINHLDAVGSTWGAVGEENRARTEKIDINVLPKKSKI
jgi:hypothetical protein